MRARAGVFACAQSIHRQIGLRSFVLLPAAVVTAAAMHAPAALARPSDIHWDGGSSSSFQAARHVEEADDDEARPRRRSRGHAGVRRNRDRARADSRRRARAAAARSTRRPASAQKATPRARTATPRLAALSPAAAEIVPLEQRSLVAAHPLVPDPLFPAPELPGEPAAAAALSSPPRCRGTHPSTFALAVTSFGHGFRPSEPAMIEGAWPHCRGARNPQSSVRLASLGPAVQPADAATSPSLSGGSIHWRASADCLASPLRAVLALVAESFGPLTVNSTCRGPAHNARVGGAPRSKHLTGNAVDFRVRGRYGEVLAFLVRQRAVGGYKHYGSGVFHIDTGQRRTWGARRARRA